MSIIKKIVLFIIILSVVFLMAVPLLIYNYEISSLNELPKTKKTSISKKELVKQWNKIEKNVSIEDLDSITPYWVYRLILADTFKRNPFKNTSRMAFKVAKNYIREVEEKTGKKRKGYILRYISLGIWIQRNWTAEQIVEEYNMIIKEFKKRDERNKARRLERKLKDKERIKD